MKPLTREWVNKAEGDFATASREMRANPATRTWREKPTPIAEKLERSFA